MYKIVFALPNLPVLKTPEGYQALVDSVEFDVKEDGQVIINKMVTYFDRWRLGPAGASVIPVPKWVEEVDIAKDRVKVG